MPPELHSAAISSVNAALSCGLGVFSTLRRGGAHAVRHVLLRQGRRRVWVGGAVEARGERRAWLKTPGRF